MYPWAAIRWAFCMATLARQGLQASGGRPFWARSWLIRICWVEPVAGGGGVGRGGGGAGAGAGAGAATGGTGIGVATGGLTGRRRRRFQSRGEPSAEANVTATYA